jgi:RNase P subunit RPR2
MTLKHHESIPKNENVPEDRILIWCNYCGQKYRLPQNLAGHTGTCDECKNDFLIPYVSQTEPELKEAISFPCKHCDKKLLKPQELAGSEISCYECGKKNIVPETLAEKESSINLLEPFIVAETTRTDITAVRPVAETKSAEEDRILFWCNHCGQKYRLPRRLDGKTGVCIKCQNYLFIPHVSQTKPELKKTVSFPCEHCGKKQLKAQELAGTEISCYECGKNNIVPEKSKKSLAKIVNPIRLLEPFLVAETTRTDLPLPEDKILFWCSHCGQKYCLPQNLDGKAGICTKCQSYLFIPHVSQTKPNLEKTVVFPCKHCGQKLRKTRKLIGTEISCSNCSKKNLVPEKSKISSLPKSGSAPEDRILFWCSYCAQKYRLPQHLAGKTGTCDRCQKKFIIPQESQTKPELQKTIIFPCEHCDKDLWETQELAGTEIRCGRCGEESIVPEKPGTEQINPEKTFGVSNAAKIAAKDLLVTERSTQTSKKATSEISSLLSLSENAAKAPLSYKKQIIITDNPPTIHKLKNHFNKKAGKSFISAMFVTFIDYVIDRHESGRRLSKPFILFCTFTFAAIILLGTWSFVMAEPPEKNNKSRYNITCGKCGHNEIRRFKDITKQTCAKCARSVGFTYGCDNCNKFFACDETKRTKKTKEDNPISIKCPFCHSEDTHYVTTKNSGRTIR